MLNRDVREFGVWFKEARKVLLERKMEKNNSTQLVCQTSADSYNKKLGHDQKQLNEYYPDPKRDEIRRQADLAYKLNKETVH